MTQQNHRANVWITPETRAHLVAIGTAHGAAQGREMSPGIRVAAKYHSRLVEALRGLVEYAEANDPLCPALGGAKGLLREIEVAG